MSGFLCWIQVRRREEDDIALCVADTSCVLGGCRLGLRGERGTRSISLILSKLLGVDDVDISGLAAGSGCFRLVSSAVVCFPQFVLLLLDLLLLFTYLGNPPLWNGEVSHIFYFSSTFCFNI